MNVRQTLTKKLWVLGGNTHATVWHVIRLGRHRRDYAPHHRAIKPDELTPKLAIEMLRIGVEVEGEALGLGDVAPNLLHDHEDALRLREAVLSAQEVLERHARAGDFGNVAKQAYDPPVKRSHVNGEELGSQLQ